MAYARALYEFQGNAAAQELSFPAGAEIRLINTNIGDGWWEGEYNGTSGLFPETYVEKMETNRKSLARATTVSRSSSGEGASANNDDWGSPSGNGAPGAAGAGKVGKNLNRFSPFVKSGAEGYLLSTSNKQQNESHYIEAGPRWSTSTTHDPISVTDPHTKSKMMRDYTAYTITSSFGEVERRFKHFEWLRDRLDEKFAILPLVPLTPETKFTGRLNEQFVQKRQKNLEEYLNRLARHPIIRESEVFRHFLSCKEEKAWKAGKRTAEKDPVSGSKFIATITLNNCVLPPTETHTYAVNKFGGFVKAMKKDIGDILKTVDTMNTHMAEFSKLYTVMSERFNKLAKGSNPNDPLQNSTVNDLGHWDSRDGVSDAAPLTSAIGSTAKAFADIAALWKTESEYTSEPFCDSLREYDSMLEPMPDFVDVHGATYRKMQDAQQKDPAQADSLVPRADVIYAIVLAEDNHFHEGRIADFNRIMRTYIQSQIYHHQRIIAALEESLATYR